MLVTVVVVVEEVQVVVVPMVDAVDAWERTDGVAFLVGFGTL